MTTPLDPDALHECDDPDCALPDLTNLEAAFVSRALDEIVAHPNEMDTVVLNGDDGRAYVLLVRWRGDAAVPLAVVWMPGMLDVLGPFIRGGGRVN